MDFYIHCPHCQERIKEASPWEWWEWQIALWLQAEVAPGLQAGYDSPRSKLFTGKTFQVKYSGATMRKQTRRPIWAWSSSGAQGNADFYVLIGRIPDEDAHRIFCLSAAAWEDRSSRDRSSGARILICDTRIEFLRKGHRHQPSYWVANKLATYECKRLPDDLINYIRKVDTYQQLSLFTEPFTN